MRRAEDKVMTITDIALPTKPKVGHTYQAALGLVATYCGNGHWSLTTDTLSRRPLQIVEVGKRGFGWRPMPPLKLRPIMA